MRKTKNKWTIDKCGRCGKKHEGYTGKLDTDGVEYVVCGRTHKRINITDEWYPSPPTNEELLELLREDRPTQTIHLVEDFRVHPLSGLCDVLYEVDVIMDYQSLDCEITSLKSIKGIPYPVKPFADLQRKWELETIESWTKNQKEE